MGLINKPKKEWADPNREGKSNGKEAERFCSRCGNSVKKFRILKALNLCELCVKELEDKRDGIQSCRGCGKVSPQEIAEHSGYCKQCICPACGKPDPIYVRKTGLCFQCAASVGDFCRSCGKEATAQVSKNKGLCNECLLKKPKTRVRTRPANGGMKASTRSVNRGMKASTRPVSEGMKASTRSVNRGMKASTRHVSEGMKASTRHVSEGMKASTRSVNGGMKTNTRSINGGMKVHVNTRKSNSINERVNQEKK